MAYEENLEVLPSVPYLERRTYIATPGKFEAILHRFRDHTFRYFAKHDINIVTFGYEARAPGSLEYTLAWRDGDHKRASWSAFLDDQEWVRIRDRTQLDGLLVEEVRVQLFLIPDWAAPRRGCELNAPIERLSMDQERDVVASDEVWPGRTDHDFKGRARDCT